MDVPNVPVSEPVEPSTGARTASASQHNTRLRRRTRESGASTAVDDAQHEKSALAPASDALPVTDRENPPEGRVAWDTTRPGGTRASVEIPTRPSWRSDRDAEPTLPTSAGLTSSSSASHRRHRANAGGGDEDQAMGAGKWKHPGDPPGTDNEEHIHGARNPGRATGPHEPRVAERGQQREEHGEGQFFTCPAISTAEVLRCS